MSSWIRVVVEVNSDLANKHVIDLIEFLIILPRTEI